nr:uncharacterized protein LOC102462128 [Pelodiscus sinensis]|eukprot:XP_006129853.1 uncharacterized protein LOC102462128 [Pelodiscus sinensis]
MQSTKHFSLATQLINGACIVTQAAFVQLPLPHFPLSYSQAVSRIPLLPVQSGDEEEGKGSVEVRVSPYPCPISAEQGSGRGRPTAELLQSEAWTVVWAINSILLPSIWETWMRPGHLSGSPGCVCGWICCPGVPELQGSHRWDPHPDPSLRTSSRPLHKLQGLLFDGGADLVNHHGHFTDIFVGWLGRAHDTRIFRNSSLYRELEVGTFFSC